MEVPVAEQADHLAMHLREPCSPREPCLSPAQERVRAGPALEHWTGPVLLPRQQG